MSNQQDRYNAYARPTATGVSIDTEGMMVDLVTFLKVGGCPKEEFLKMASQIWEEVQVDLHIPQRSKN